MTEKWISKYYTQYANNTEDALELSKRQTFYFKHLHLTDKSARQSRQQVVGIWLAKCEAACVENGRSLKIAIVKIYCVFVNKSVKEYSEVSNYYFSRCCIRDTSLNSGT